MSRFLFLGDSITDAYHSYDTEELGEGYVRYIAEQLGLGFDETLRITNAGHDGFTIDSLLTGWNRNFASCSAEDYDVVSVLIGANDTGLLVDTGMSETEADANFRKKMNLLAQSLKESGIGTVILMEPFLFPVTDAVKQSLPQITRFADTVRDAAQQYGFLFLPTQDAFDQAAARDGYDYLTEDGIHPTDQGHRLLADLWLNTYRANLDP